MLKPISAGHESDTFGGEITNTRHFSNYSLLHSAIRFDPTRFSETSFPFDRTFAKSSAPMNWKKWPKLLEHQWEILGNDYKGLLALLQLKESHLDWGCAIADFEDECREEVEEAILQFASTGDWPELSPIGGAMLLERLSYANNLMDELQWYAKELKMGAPTQDMDEEETICWFLIDAWNKFGFDNLNSIVRAIPTHEIEACRELDRKLKKDFYRPEDN